MSSTADSESSVVSIRSDQDGRASGQRPWLEIALIFVVFFVAGGAPVPHLNETHYLAKAKQYWQPDWCAGDLFLESGKAHLTFYWTVGLLTKWFTLPTVAWIGRLTAWLALAIAWQRLSRTVTGLPFRGVLSAMLLVTLIDWTNFAGEWVVGGVEGKCFAYACVFWGLAALAEERWRTVWPCLGLAAAFHVLVGGWSVIAAAFVWLWQPRDNRPTLASMLPALLLGGVFALPGVVPALHLTQTVSPETVSQANQIYVFDRLPHHLSPLTLSGRELGRKALRFGLLLLGFAWLRFFCTRQTLCIQQPENPPLAPPCEGGGLDSSSFRPLDLLMRFAVATLVISVAGLAWELATWNHPAVAARILKYYVFRLADIAVPLATSLGVGWLTHRLLLRQSKWGVALLLLAVSLPTLHLLNISRTRFQTPCPPADRRLKDVAAFREACDWVRDHTPTDALFLVPRHAQSFKWYASRSDLVTWKDVPQSADALLTWRKRFFDVHKHYNEAGEYVSYGSLASQGTARIRELAEKYQFDYVLTNEYPPLLLPVVYTNDTYTIYSVSGKGAGD
ncbi:MAG: hypothetical protein GXP24_05250 [Planctomycetes bacterium]|nr:hypothetical protein [Planctomycetota bacterium]